MVTKQFSGLPEDADLRRADSLAREIFSDVANKWALLIIEALGERTLRFGEVRDEVEGISHKMLTQNLRMLERNGLVERNVHPTVPPKVEYTLTEPGRGLRETVDLMCDWTQRHLGHIENSRARFRPDRQDASQGQSSSRDQSPPFVAGPGAVRR
ncbi:winged helix-turn-helix transcriptional regulator [Streptomyces sp. NPDC059943]|uniref:winged helix-turn-helix transcriptional regulator n=1 Tax=Streptomyces sp. NPDC059943 TaxID=3347010 RepID=UPI003653DC82